MMGPTLFQSSTEEYHKILRRMELETYGAVVSTLRAQGELNKDRRKLLEDLSVLMKISPERHKAEIRRAVNDEKLSEIADKTSGVVDTEWAWALEGRRVVPLMPRLVQSTPFTSLATTVSKAVAQNPKICLNQAPVCDTDDSTSKYVRDPDDEDTLSPVMVPIASPDSSCHSNNNFDSDMSETPLERTLTFSLSNEIDKKSEGGLLKTVVPIGPPPVKRPRSPVSNQVVNAAPLPKVRAVSPSCVRPQHRIAAPPQPIISQAVRGPVAPTIKPAAPIHLANHSPAPFSKVRIRPPVVSANSQRPTARPTAPQNPPVGASTPRIANNVKQIVQVRAPQQPKETNKTPTTAVANSVAPNLAKTLPAKANVIVLHKNSPLVKNMQQQQTAATKEGNFLAKSVSTPAGTKMTFPSNVRIISVPTGSNIGVASGGSAGASGQKMVTSTGNVPASQKNVYVLELSNDNVGKSILLGDIIPAGLVPEVNGVKAKLPAQNVNVKTAVKEEPESRSQILSSEESADTNGQVASSTTSESEDFLRKYGFEFPAKESRTEGNSGADHVLIQSVNETVSKSGELSDQPGEIIYDSPKEDTSTTQVIEQSPMDIFSTAIASADINLDTNTFHEDNGGSRLVLKDVYDSPSAKL